MSHWLDALPELDPAERQKARGEADPGAWLVNHKLATWPQVLEVASLFYRVPAVQLSLYTPDSECLHKLTDQQTRRYRTLPLFRVKDRLYVAVSDPTNLQALDFVANVTGMAVEPVLAFASDIDQALNRWFLSEEQSSRALEEIASRQVETRSTLFTQQSLEDRDVPVIKMVDHVFAQAIRLGASDVHLEPTPERVGLRYRVDGWLRDFPGPPISMYPAVVSRIKIESGLDIAERRLPQDGRSSIVVDGRDYDLRISIIPNLHGEGVVVRILNPHAIQLDLSAMGFDSALLERYERILRKPHGVMLVTGPTGSGKSTTLYATLKRISDPRKKIITMEDPVELQIAGVTQIQVQSEIGYSFAQGLRAILRHDPDTVLVGEIRDAETAQIAIRAALTGHQMFSTLHTNDAPQAITRLLDMGIPYYQLSAALNGVLAQRLLRRLCPHCKEPDVVGVKELRQINLEPGDYTVYRPVGCSECYNYGYKGRVAIYEFLEMTRTMRRLNQEEAQPENIREIGLREGSFSTLLESACHKLKLGLTSLEEVMALGGDD